MNDILYQLIKSIQEDEIILNELIKIDNKILGTNYSIKTLLNDINELISENKQEKIIIDEKTLIITDGIPKDTLDIINRISINEECILFINRYCVAINKWLINEFQNITGNKIDLDIDINYNKHLNSNIRKLIVKGEEELINAVNREFFED